MFATELTAPKGRPVTFISANKFPILITLVFFLLSLVGIMNHEIWLDEAQHFLLARDSNSISELIYNCRLEGHPLIWNMLLYLLTRFTDDVFYMQLLHILINCITVFVISRTRLGLLEKLLIIFSYFIFYEYNIISRNYGISVLFAVLAVEAWLNGKRSLIYFSLLIFMLANSHLYAYLFSLALFITIFLFDRNFFKADRRQLILTYCIILVGWIIAALSIIPPAEYRYLFAGYESSGYLSDERLIKTFSVCLKGIFYIPDYYASDHAIQNSLWLFTLGLRSWEIYLLSAISIAVPAFLIRKSRSALSLYFLFFILYALCNYFLPLVNGIRYFGFFYIAFILCYLIALPTISTKGRAIALIIFLLQFINGMYFYSVDLNYPFSQSRQTVEILNAMSKPETEVLILDRTLRPGISAYTGEKYFGVESGEQLSYCKWDQHLTDEILKLKVDSILSAHQYTIIIAGYSHSELLDTTKLKLFAPLPPSINRGESTNIYWYER